MIPTTNIELHSEEHYSFQYDGVFVSMFSHGDNCPQMYGGEYGEPKLCAKMLLGSRVNFVVHGNNASSSFARYIDRSAEDRDVICSDGISYLFSMQDKS